MSSEKSQSFAVIFANVTLLTAMAGFAVLLVYALLRSWQIGAAVPTLQKSYLYPIFALFSGCGMVGCFTIFRLHDGLKINIALLLVSTVSTLYVIEGGLLILTLCMSSGTLQDPDDSTFEERVHLARKFRMFFDSRTPLEVVVDLRARQIEAYPAMLPVYFVEQPVKTHEPPETLPLGGISHKLTVLCNETGEYAIYESDEHGFNNPYGVFEQRSIDIILVGDSFTHGYCVKQGGDIAGRLRHKGKTVVNLGMGANGPLLELASLKEFAEPLRPNIVLWMYYEGNDLQDLERDYASALLRRYMEEEDYSQDLIHRQAEVDALLQHYSRARMRQEQWVMQQKQPKVLAAKFLKLWRLRNLFGLAPLPASQKSPYTLRHPVADSLRLLARVLATANEMTSAWGGKLYVVYLPSWERYAKDIDQRTFMRRDRVFALLQELHLPLIDVHEMLMQHDDPLSLIPFRGRGHFTREGYDLIARGIAAHLQEDAF